MDVEDGLARIRIAVENRAVSTFGVPVLCRQRRPATDHLAHEPVVVGTKVVQARDMTARHNEHVHRSLWVDVFERDQAIVGIDNRAGDLASDDLAEEAVGHRAIVVLSDRRPASAKATARQADSSLRKGRHPLYALQVSSNRHGAPARCGGESAHGVCLTVPELHDQRPVASQM